MSPEVKSKEKRGIRLTENEHVNDEESKFSDENRSTLPLHSDSFKKNNSKDKNYIFQESNRELADSKHEESVCSPNFMGVGALSSSNPFMPWESKNKSLEYETSPRELFKNPLESFACKLSELKAKFGRQKLIEIIGMILPESPKKDFGSQVNTVKQELDQKRVMEQENSELRKQLAHCTEANLKYKEKYEAFWERSSLLEKLLRERESTIYFMRLENDACSTELKNARLMEEHMKNEIDSIKAKREEVEEKFKESKLARGQDAIFIRQLKADKEAKIKEIIEASELTTRVTNELEELRKENFEIK